MKSRGELQRILRHGVTPHAGVRIEIDYITRYCASFDVTPHAGVRIEMSYYSTLTLDPEVTPHAGVRIEIDHLR